MAETTTYDDLGTLARTAVAAGHAGVLTLAGGLRLNVGYLDDGGEPLIVWPAPATVLHGPACLAIQPEDGARVVLGGRLVHVTGPDRAAAELLAVHASCFAEAMHAGPVRLVRLAVDAVRVDQDSRGVDVPCTTFATASPDLWSAFAVEVARHLSDAHVDALLEVAERHLPLDEVIGVAVRRLRRDIVDLDVVTTLGALQLEVALSGGLDDPHELCRRLRDLTHDAAAGELS